MIDPGALRTRLTIEAPVEAADGQGGVARSYAALTTVWAQVVPLGTRHDLSADADGAAVRYRIVMRGNVALTLQHRLVEGPRIYRIIGLRNRDDRRFVEIDAELRVE